MPEWLQQAASGEGPLPWTVFLARLSVAFAYGWLAAGIHYIASGRPRRRTDRGFLATLVLLSVLIALVTLVIGDNVARAFSLVGSLAIVRFRTVVEDTRDTAFVIFAVVMGMAAGTGYWSGPLICAPFVLVVNPSNPKTRSVATFADFVKLATAKPESIDYGTGGIGNLAHLSFELLGTTIGARMVHVPYAGAAPAQAALLSSQVDAAFDTPNALPLIQSGRLRALAVSTPVRWRDLPDVPTVAESGYPSFATSFWTGVVAPAKTPQPVIDTLYKAIVAATEDPKTKALLLGQGNIEVLDPAAFAKKIAEEGKLNAEVLKKAGIEKQ